MNAAFSKTDFLEYIKQAKVMERRMTDVYASLLEKVEDDDIRKAFEKLLASERKHVDILNAMEALCKP